jgi:hypothetical protein
MTDVWPSQKHLPLIGDSCIEQINEAYADMLAGKNICGCIRME